MMSCKSSFMQLLIALAVFLGITCTLLEARVLPVEHVHAMQGECMHA